jgi:protein-arginine kinase activator protein McsA
MSKNKKDQKKEKPIEKMTAKELREVAMELSEITGAHGMNKAELVSAIKKAKGIEDGNSKSKDASVREIKGKIKELKIKREAALKGEDAETATVLRRRISRLKRKTRSAA